MSVMAVCGGEPCEAPAWPAKVNEWCRRGEPVALVQFPGAVVRPVLLVARICATLPAGEARDSSRRLLVGGGAATLYLTLGPCR